MVSYWLENWAGYYQWVRLGDWHAEKNVTLFGTDPNWLDVNNYGYAQDRNAYILASMASLAEFPEKAKSIFMTQDLNKEGIYAVKLYIRGKPWLVTVDDEIVLTATQKKMGRVRGWQHLYAHIGDDASIWGAILEKSWAKVKGSYKSSYEGGLMTNGIRALIGSPVFTYTLDEEENQQDDFWQSLYYSD